MVEKQRQAWVEQQRDEQDGAVASSRHHSSKDTTASSCDPASLSCDPPSLSVGTASSGLAIVVCIVWSGQIPLSPGE